MPDFSFHITTLFQAASLPYMVAAKSLQSCPTFCDPIDGSPAGSPIPGILQARTLEWAAISFSNARKWKVKVKSLNGIRLLATLWTAAYQAPPSMGFPGKSTGVGCHCLLQGFHLKNLKTKVSRRKGILDRRVDVRCCRKHTRRSMKPKGDALRKVNGPLA